MSDSGTFTAVGDVSKVALFARDDSATLTLTNTGGHAWSVVLEESVGGQAWRPITTFSADQAAIKITPALQRAFQLRLRLASVAGGDSIAYTLSSVATLAGLTVALVGGVPEIVEPFTSLDAVLKVASVTVTNAQVKALPTTPVAVLAAPGAGKVIVPVAASFVAKFAAGAYTNVNAAAGVLLKWGTGTGATYYARLADASTAILSSAASQFFPATAGTFNDGNGTTLSPGGVLTSFANLPLNVAGVNASDGVWTGGNAANTLIVAIAYYLLDV